MVGRQQMLFTPNTVRAWIYLEFVQLKLCVLDEELIDEFGPKISEYANTQNAIKELTLQQTIRFTGA